MKTITIVIGNTDNKLTQQLWAAFVQRVKTVVEEYADFIYFFGGSENWAEWQNVTWVVFCDDEAATYLKRVLTRIRINYLQDSVAWVEGGTTFI